MVADRVRRWLKPAWRVVSAQREKVLLRRLRRIACVVSALGRADGATVAAVLADPRMDHEWQGAAARLAALAIADKETGGVNPGDRRAIYTLVRHVRTAAVLEVGTHIGASTAHIAEALRATSAELGRPGQFDLTTVDIVDVNDEKVRRWIRSGSTYSPAELMRRLGCESSVTFVTRPSLEYMSDCTKRYGLIFLDGDHSAHTVYREIPAALNLLDEGGYILLHDYFPGLRPLWAGTPAIRGPWLATERLRREGVPIRVVPLGALPWPTKRGSTVTSLALVTNASPTD